MWHALCRQVNRVDSWLLVVESQIARLTPDLYFVHNLCFRCPNEQCEPILDIYALRAFQWYKELFQPWSFDSWNLFFEDLGVHQDSNSQSWIPFGSVRVHSRSLSCTLKSIRNDSRAPFWLATLQPLCFGREPKARVATFGKAQIKNLFGFHIPKVLISLCLHEFCKFCELQVPFRWVGKIWM